MGHNCHKPWFLKLFCTYWSTPLPMSQPKVIRSLLLLLFLSVVTSGIFFLLSLQLTPLVSEIGHTISTTKGVIAEAAPLRPTPTSTMPALTLDMVATADPTPIPPVSTPVATSSLLPTPPSSHMGTVNSDVVNLRSYPSLAGEVVGQAKQGEHFQIMAVSNDGLWVQVCCPLGSSEPTHQSWVSTEFMTLEPTAASAPPAASPAALGAQPVGTMAGVAASQQNITSGVSGTVNGALVNLRSGPATTYPTVGQVNEQTKVMITGRNADGTWWQICCPPGVPQASWISAEFIDLAVAKEQALVQVATAFEQ